MEQALRQCLVKYADYSGRASLAEFWWFLLGVETLACVTLCLAVLLPALAPLGLAALALALPPGLAVTVRRLHDTGASGRRALAVLVPVIGPVLLLRWLAQPSVAGDTAPFATADHHPA